MIMYDNLPFETRGYGDKAEAYDQRMANLSKEKNLNGSDITNIIIEKLKSANLLITTEKNVRGVNENPFDIVAGNEKELQMTGFEVKGDTDNFSRLKDQLRAYTSVFDGVYVVLHKKKEPEWLPQNVGIIRVFEDKEVYVESHSYMWDDLDISTSYEWDALFKCNGLTNRSGKVRETLKIIKGVRRNVLFNRFFAVHTGYNTHQFEKWWPLSDKQKSVIIGFDVPEHYKILKKDIVLLEKRLQILKEAILLGQKGLGDYEK